MDASSGSPAVVAEIEAMKPRPYQDQLLEISLERNTIIYLPTGAGKTYIALMAMKRMSADLTRPLADGGRRSIFLVNTVALANQQVEAIRKATPLRVAKYTGDMNVDAWRRNRWQAEFEENQVLVATCQIILDVLRHGFVRLDHINLIIMDECHHGRNNHPMHQLMQLYGEHPATALRPRIIGLTGMLISGSVQPENVVIELNKLEAVFQARIATVRTYQELNNVLVYSTKPKELLIKYADGHNADVDIVRRVNVAIENLLKIIEAWPVDQTHQIASRLKSEGEMPLPRKTLNTLFKDFQYQLDDLGLYGASLAILSVIVELSLRIRSADTRNLRWLIRVLITGADRIRHWIVNEIYDNEDDQEDDDMGTILSNSSHKMIQFLLFLRQFYAKFVTDKRLNSSGEPVPLKALVFVHRRRSAKCVFLVLQRFAKCLGSEHFDIRSDFMVGNNSKLPESVETLLENKWSRRVLERFRENEINLIVASSVLEEGIDLQECNLVVSLDLPMSFRSYVQSKGRARMENSDYLMFVPSSAEAKTIVTVNQWRGVETELKRYLIEKAVDRKGPLEEDIVRELGLDKRFAYRTNKGALLDEMSAVQLLMRYCHTLPFDSVAPPRVDWDKQVLVEGGAGAKRTVGSVSMGPVKMTVTIRLPMQSTVRHSIQGRPCLTMASAKRSAAFDACVQLHKAGELDDNLMPINARRCLETVSGDYFRHWRQYENDVQRDAGTRKCIRMHTIIWPTVLQNCNPARSLQSFCCLHVIHMEPAFEPTSSTDPTIAGVHRLLDASSSRRFGILTANPLPAIGLVKLFQNFGAITVRLSHKPMMLPWNDSARAIVGTLRRAHENLFEQLLGIRHPFLFASSDGNESAANAVNDFLIVPCTPCNEIDMSAVQKLLEHTATMPPPPNEFSRQSNRYDPQNYVNAVVVPWYQHDPNRRYVVTRVCHDRTPFGAAPAGSLPSNYTSYADYVRQNWPSIRPVNQNTSFMLEVRGITQKLNRLAAGALADGSRKAGQRKHVEYIIPELCHMFGVPADLWLQATMLPSFLHRLQYALNAEELRREINAALGIQNDPIELAALPEALPIVQTPNELAQERNPMSTEPERIQYLADPWSMDELEDNFADLDIVLPLSTNSRQDAKKPKKIANDIIACPWSEFEEPADFDRKSIDEIYNLDLQYYMNFIDQHESEIDLTAIHRNSLGEITDGLSSSDRPAVHPIRLLDITINSFTAGPRQCDLLAALTVNRSGDVFNGERLEVLGDAFLKFAASTFLLSQHPTWHEGHLTSCKGQMVSNRNLFYLGSQRRLAGRLKVYPFDPKNTWTPPAMHLHADLQRLMRTKTISAKILLDFPSRHNDNGAANKNTQQFLHDVAIFSKHVLDSVQTVDEAAAARTAAGQPLQAYLGQQAIADKVVADAVEACLGATLLAVGFERSFNALRFWGILPDPTSIGLPTNSYEQLLHAKLVRSRIHSECPQRDIDDLLPNFTLLEKRLGYTFRDRAYLLQALTHPSFLCNSITGCYQQLEFLGDAVLDVLITTHIYERCPDMQPGRMSDLRSSLVNNVTLACLCVRYGIQRFVLSQNAVLTDQITTFVEFQQARDHRVTEMVLLLTMNDDDDDDDAANVNAAVAPKAVQMGEHVDVPKMLGDVMEALIGAIFLDSGNDLRRTWDIVFGLMHAEIEAFVVDTPLQAVRRLGEFVSAAARYDAPYVNDGLVMVRVLYTCRNVCKEACGFGRNAAAAKMAAAGTALNDLLVH